MLGHAVRREAMESTQNFSWTIGERDAFHFAGPSIGDFMVATGGMTIGEERLLRPNDSGWDDRRELRLRVLRGSGHAQG